MTTTALPARRGWHRPVRRRDVALVMTSAALIWVALLAAAAWHVREHWQSVVALRDQTVTLRLPTGMPARAEVHTPLFLRLDTQSKVAVPIDQLVSVQLLNKLSAQAVINTTVPVDTSVSFDQDIPVSTEVEMKIPVVSWLPAMNVMVPVTFKVPVHLTVPIKVQLPLALNVRVTGQVSDPIKVPVRTTMHLSVPVHTKLQADVLNRADFNLVGLQAPFDLRIDQAEVRTPLRDIEWCRSITCVGSEEAAHVQQGQ
ncbi:MAG: hypothetical protein Q7V20_23745 [Aquabacterium sp.]|uniref:hypothetical protein n=1 Tax=Aquabacterium sp. TaxID=1872578 RepID=UPI00271AD9E0|nr:hypothetical protein [Aquabacterium sp.]MDO9006468.1 hypothetical protein [Aquabacterium sp.]